MDAKKSDLNANLVLSSFVVVFGSSFLFGYNIGVLNQPANLIKDFYRDVFTKRYGNESVTEAMITVTWSLTTALFIPGGMLGALLGGILADSLGRKRTLLLSHAFVFSGAALATACVAAETPELLMIGRILLGINSGFANCIAPMFLSEVAPLRRRGAFGTLHQLFVTIGIFLSSVFGLEQLLGSVDLWPFLILIETIPAFASLVVVPFLPETPRFLLLVRKDRDGARKALRFYRKTNDVGADMEEMDAELLAGSKDTEQMYTWKHLFHSHDLRRPLFIACFLQVAQQFSGINAVFFYSKSIFESAKVNGDHIPFAIIGTNAVNVFMTVIAVPLMDAVGRRPLLLLPMAVMIVDLVLMTICRLLQANDPTIAGIAYVTVACVIIYVIAFAVGLGPIPMMIGAELFRQGPRPKAMAAASVVNWVGTFTIAMAFESVQTLAGDYTFVVFIVFLFGFLVVTYFFVPETKNRTIEEIAAHFSSKAIESTEKKKEEEEEEEMKQLQGGGRGGGGGGGGESPTKEGDEEVTPLAGDNEKATLKAEEAEAEAGRQRR